MKHIGMDLGATTTSVTVLSSRGKRIMSRTIRTCEGELVKLVSAIPGEKRVVVEECQMADWVCRSLSRHVTEFIRCQPQHNALISRSENKCDQEDGYVLARLSYLDELKPVQHTGWEFRQLREVVRAYWKSSWDLTSAKNRLKAYFLFNGIHCTGETVYSIRWREAYCQKLNERSANVKLGELHNRRLDMCRELKSEHICLMREQARPFVKEIACLKSIPGIGPIVAYTLIAYLERGRRFSNKRQLWKYCRLAVRKHESQGKGHQGASRQGNRYLKSALMATVASLVAREREDNSLSRYWHDGLARGTEPERMRRNLARKVVVIAHHLLRQKEEYKNELMLDAG